MVGLKSIVHLSSSMSGWGNWGAHCTSAEKIWNFGKHSIFWELAWPSFMQSLKWEFWFIANMIFVRKLHHRDFLVEQFHTQKAPGLQHYQILVKLTLQMNSLWANIIRFEAKQCSISLLVLPQISMFYCFWSMRERERSHNFCDLS